MRQKGHMQDKKALTRDFAPYCFSTFSRSCLKQASKRSWKGLSASVTFSPWMRTPSARCGIWKGQNVSIYGWGLVTCQFFIHWSDTSHTSNLTLWTFNPVAVHTRQNQWLCINHNDSVCTKRKYRCGHIQVEAEKSVAMTVPPTTDINTSEHRYIKEAMKKHRQI